MSRHRLLSLLILSVFAITFIAAPAFAATSTFGNSGNIAIPATGTVGVASPYPSTINVSGMTGTITDVNVTLSGMNHTFPDDVNILLVGSSGKRLVIFSDVGGASDIVNVTFTLDDAAASALPDHGPLVGGTFRPTDIDVTDIFASPAPGGPYFSALSAFNGDNPNGNWSLYVVDDLTGDSGSIAGGWSLEITTGDAPAFTSAAPPAATVSVPYSHTFTASGDPAPTITLTGTLPAGLTFDAGTATISGTPTTAGTSAGLAATASNGVSPDAIQNFDLDVTAVPVALAEVPTPPPPGLCGDMNGAGNDLLRSNFEHEADRSAVSCRMLAADGEYMTWLGGQLTHDANIGDPTTVSMGVIGAVDVFNGGSSFVAGVNICLHGGGRMIFLDAADAPRIPREWNAWTTDAFPGFTCTTIWSPGTVVLVGDVAASGADAAAGGEK